MQVVGTILGTVVLMYAAMAAAQLRRQGLQSRLRSELSLDLLREQIKATSLLRERREQQQLCWNGYRKFLVQKKVWEADNVCSFYLIPHDCKSLPLFRPGQFLTFRLNVPGLDKPVVRCYSISSSPNADYYRITVKRCENGTASSFLHDRVEEGAILDVQAPRGDFCVDRSGTRPAVLVGGGVGVTPFVSMLEAASKDQNGRELTLVYAVRNGSEHAMKERLSQLSSEQDNVNVVTAYSQPGAEDRLGVDYDHCGRVSPELLRSVLPSNNFDFYICGPPQMMQDLMAQLKDWGVPSSNIFTEAFGAPSAQAIRERKTAAQSNGDSATPISKKNDDSGRTPSMPVKKVRVEFSISQKSADWDDTKSDLLQLAKVAGVEIDSGCGAGSCGTCQTAVRSGKVRYPSPPDFCCEDRTCLPCVAVPAGDLVLDA
jgi:uncharacterized protein